MLGWDSRAAVRASLRNLSFRPGRADISAGSSLSATMRSRATSRARNTTPMPPRPSSRSMEYRPATAAWKARNSSDGHVDGRNMATGCGYSSNAPS